MCHLVLFAPFSLVARMVKTPPEMQETQVRSLDQEDPLEKGIAAHSSILVWRIPWTEEPDRLYGPWGYKAFCLLLCHMLVLMSCIKIPLATGNTHNWNWQKIKKMDWFTEWTIPVVAQVSGALWSRDSYESLNRALSGTVGRVIIISIIISYLKIRKTKNSRTVSESDKAKWQVNDRPKIQTYILRLQTNAALGAKAFYTVLLRLIKGIVLWSSNNLSEKNLNLSLHSNRNLLWVRLEKGTAPHSSILAWRIPWTEEPGRPHSMGSQRVRHNWATKQTSIQYWSGANTKAFQTRLGFQVFILQGPCTAPDVGTRQWVYNRDLAN